jgi:hypothetical protein
MRLIALSSWTKPAAQALAMSRSIYWVVRGRVLRHLQLWQATGDPKDFERLAFDDSDGARITFHARPRDVRYARIGAS